MGVDDEIRAEIKESVEYIKNYNKDKKKAVELVRYAVHRVKEMIFKEENILFPMALETLTEDEWLKIAHDSDEIGYTLVKPAGKWKPERKEGVSPSPKAVTDNKGAIRLETGVFNVEELEAMLNTLPVDITFVDKDNIVKYFSHGAERIFPRTKSVIGRSVENCHPPASVHVVEKVVEDLRSGKKDHEDFWIKMGEKYVLIRYFAVRGADGEYLGTLEFSQNIKPLQEITGEKRLLDE